MTIPGIIPPALGAFLFYAGARKLYGWEWGKQQYLRYHRIWVYYASGVIEVVAGPGLALPWDGARRLSAAVLLAMIAYVSAHKWEVSRVSYSTTIPGFISIALLCWIVWPAS